MEKILTIVICAYNMEVYIRDALKSCEIMDIDKLEVLIMNDGSYDNTAEIAQEYCKKYPRSFKLINKENGGWGSNINMAVSIATGKYFKILDADDWFEKENLQKFVTLLEQIEADLVTSLYSYCSEMARQVIHMNWEKYAGHKYALSSVLDNIHLSIWGVAFRLQFLKEHFNDLPIHMLYTDTLFILQNLCYVDQIYFCDYILYNYRLGRDGQSVSPDSVRKHYSEMLNVFNLEIDYYILKGIISQNQIHVMNRLATTYFSMCEAFLKTHDKKLQLANYIKKCDMEVKEVIPELYKVTGKRRFIQMLRMTNYKIPKTISLILQFREYLKGNV